MRMLLNVKFPNAEFNIAVRDGSAGKKIGQILEELKPEAVYFTEQHGQRSALTSIRPMGYSARTNVWVTEQRYPGRCELFERC